MAVNRCIIHSWSSPAVFDGSEIHPFWSKSSTRQLLQINLSNDDALLANAATIGVEYAQGVENLLSKVDDATNAGAVGKRREEYSIYVHGWANRSNMRGLTNAADRIEGWFTAYPDDAVNAGPFIANGVAECKAWGNVFLDSLKAELDSRGLPYPARMHMDTEATIDVGSVYAAMPTSSGYEGWMQFALDDPRATTELIDGVFTFQQHVDNWDPLDAATDLTWSTTNSYWDGVNRNLREFINYLNLRLRDWLHYEGMMAKAQSLFPGMTWGNWNHGQTGDRSNVSHGRSKADMRLYEDTGPWSEWTSPALYPLRGPTMQGGGSQKEDWAANLGISIDSNGPPYDDEYTLIWTTRAIQEARNAVIVGGASTFAPWINHPGETYDISSQYLDNVTLVTISSSDAANFAVGNTISLQDSGDVELYSGTIVRVADLGNGNHYVNVDNQSPTGTTNYGSVAKAVDGTIGVSSAVSNVAEESAYTYTTTYAAIESVLEQCVTDGVTEYIFWQGGQINDERWLLVADMADYVEEGLGVRLGEAAQPVVEASGSQMTLSFSPPANGPWVLSNLEIDNLQEPSVLKNGSPVSFSTVESGDLSVDGDGNLNVALTFPDRTFLSEDTVDVTLNEGWITDSTPNFRTSATMNVGFGVGANPSSSQMSAQNNSGANIGTLSSSTFDFRGRTFLFTFEIPEGQQWDEATLTVDTNKEPSVFFMDGSTPAEDRWKQDERIVQQNGNLVTVSYQTRDSVAYEQFKDGILSVDIPEGWVSDGLGNSSEAVVDNTPSRANVIVPSRERTAIQFFGNQGQIVRLSNGAWSGSGFQDLANDTLDGIQIRIRFSYDNTQLPVAMEGFFSNGRGWGYGITSDDEFFFAQVSTRQDGAQPWAAKIPMSAFQSETISGVEWYEIQFSLATTGIFGGSDWVWFPGAFANDLIADSDVSGSIIYPASNVARPFPHHQSVNAPLVLGGIRGDSNWMDGYNDQAPGDIGTGIIDSGGDSSVFYARLNGYISYRDFFRNGVLTSRLDLDSINGDGEIRDDLYEETGVGINSSPGVNFDNVPSSAQPIRVYKVPDPVETWTPTTVVAEARSLGSVRLTWDIPVYAQSVINYQVDRRTDTGSGFGPWETLSRSVPAYKIGEGFEQILVEENSREQIYPNFFRDIRHYDQGTVVQYRVRGLSFEEFDYENYPIAVQDQTPFTISNAVTIPPYDSSLIPEISLQDKYVPPGLQSRIWIWSNPGNNIPSDDPPEQQGFNGTGGNYRDNVLENQYGTWLNESFGRRINYATSRPFGQNAEEKIGGGSDSAHRLIGRVVQGDSLYNPDTDPYPTYWQTALSNFLESVDGGALWSNGAGTARLDDFVEAHQELINDGYTMYIYGCPPMANMPLNDPNLIWTSADQLRMFAAAGVGLMFDSLAQTDTVDRFTGDEYLIKAMMDSMQEAGIPVFGEPGGQIGYDDPTTTDVIGSPYFAYTNYHTIQTPGGTRWSLDVINGNSDRVHVALVRAQEFLTDSFIIFYATNGGDSNDLPDEWDDWTNEEKLVWLLSNWMANTPKNWHIAFLLPFNIRQEFPNLTEEQWNTMLDAASISGSPLQAVSAVYPADSAVITDRIPARPTLSWEEQPNATSRVFFGSNESNMREVASGITGSQYKLTRDIEAGVSYSWQVRSESPAGHVLSPVFTFTATNVVPTFVKKSSKRKIKQARFNRPARRPFISEIDTLPAVVINGFTGEFNLNCDVEENQFGTPCWWRGENAVTNLIDRVESLYEAGWRRVIFNRPMGGSQNGVVSSSSWEPLTDQKKQDLQTLFKEYLETRPDLRMSIYVGFALGDSASSVADSTTGIRSLKFSSGVDVEQIRSNIAPWVDVGISEVICDGAGSDEYRDAFLQYSRLLWGRDVVCRGEPFPKMKSVASDGTSIVVPDPKYTETVPWMFFEQELTRGDVTETSWNSWEIDNDKSDIMIALQGRPGSTTEVDSAIARNYIDDWSLRGFNFIVWDQNAWFAEYILDRYNG